MKTENLVSQLAKFDIKVGFMNAGMYGKLAELIPEGDQILFAFEGLSGSGSVPVVITAQSVYLVAHAGLLGTNVAAIPVSRITSVTTKSGAFLGVLKNLYIAEGTLVHAVEKIAGNVADQAIAAINKAQSMASAPTASAAPVSQADELAKFKKLLDDGVLTQEEFDKKKAQILGL